MINHERPRCQHCGGPTYVEPSTSPHERTHGLDVICLHCGRTVTPPDHEPGRYGVALCTANLHLMTGRNLLDRPMGAVHGIGSRCRACHLAATRERNRGGRPAKAVAGVTGG